MTRLSMLLSILFLPTLTLALSNVKTLVTFGDSYTDQSRLASFVVNNTYPPPHYQEVYPPKSRAANGGASWVRYAEMYGNLESSNYAVSGATCSNRQTGRPGAVAIYPGTYTPDVIGYEVPTALKDWTSSKNASDSPLTFDPNNTVYSIWIGTNDVGVLLQGNQTRGATIANVTQCTLDWARTLHHHGARNFIFQNMIPLELTPQYSSPKTAQRMKELVHRGNELWALQVPALVNELGPGVQAALFDSHALFTDMYRNPSSFLNGTAPLNVTGSATAANTKSPDSFLWNNLLHPSEQASRVVAREIVKTLSKQNATEATYATYYGSSSWTRS